MKSHDWHFIFSNLSYYIHTLWINCFILTPIYICVCVCLNILDDSRSNIFGNWVVLWFLCFFQIHTTIRPALLKLGDHCLITLQLVQHLSYLTLLFPKLFNERLCEQMLPHLWKCLEEAEKKIRGNERTATFTEIVVAL